MRGKGGFAANLIQEGPPTDNGSSLPVDAHAQQITGVIDGGEFVARSRRIPIPDSADLVAMHRITWPQMADALRTDGHAWRGLRPHPAGYRVVFAYVITAAPGWSFTTTENPRSINCRPVRTSAFAESRLVTR